MVLRRGAERPQVVNMLRLVHRSAGCLVAAFALLHIANHLMASISIETHLRFMEQARTVYRYPAIETMLLCCVTLQAASGLSLVVASWRTRCGWIAWLQAGSGAYLALFLLIHVAAVLFGRAVLKLDTNIHFAAAGVQSPTFQYFFVPYYIFAVLALFAHLGCALSWYVGPARPWRALAIAAASVAGTVVAALIVSALAGKIHPYDVPAQYKATYESVHVRS